MRERPDPFCAKNYLIRIAFKEEEHEFRRYKESRLSSMDRRMDKREAQEIGENNNCVFALWKYNSLLVRIRFKDESLESWGEFGGKYLSLVPLGPQYGLPFQSLACTFAIAMPLKLCGWLDKYPGLATPHRKLGSRRDAVVLTSVG